MRTIKNGRVGLCERKLHHLFVNRLRFLWVGEEAVQEGWVNSRGPWKSGEEWRELELADKGCP